MLLANPSVPQLAVIAAISALGGAVNSIAGGGTLLTFPALLALGVPPVSANATSTMALWPGAHCKKKSRLKILQALPKNSWQNIHPLSRVPTPTTSPVRRIKNCDCC
jgi:hypothetical protein